jgi:hypothetical protein
VNFIMKYSFPLPGRKLRPKFPIEREYICSDFYYAYARNQAMASC